MKRKFYSLNVYWAMMAQWSSNQGANMFKEVIVPIPNDARNPQSSSLVRRSSATQKSVGKWLGQIALMTVAVTMIVPSSGCNFRNLAIREAMMVSYRDMVWAKRAYNLRYGNCNRPYGEHFQNGFCTGYSDVCNGGDGYVPAMPPADYRTFEYQSADGAQCVNAWFEGYPAGVAAARKEKVGNYNDIMISKMIDSAVTQENAAHTLPQDVPVVDPKMNRKDARTSSRSSLQHEPTASMPLSFEMNSQYIPESYDSSMMATPVSVIQPLDTKSSQISGNQLNTDSNGFPSLITGSGIEQQSDQTTTGQKSAPLNLALLPLTGESNRRSR